PSIVSTNFVGTATITVSAGSASATVHITVIPHFVLLPILADSKGATIAAMNDAGVVVGTAYDGGGSGPRAYRYTASGGVQNLGAGLVFSSAVGVNASGTAVGWAQASGG